MSPSGKDDAIGAFGTPVQTIAKGLTLAAASKLDLYVCNATYPEPVKVEAGKVRT